MQSTESEANKANADRSLGYHSLVDYVTVCGYIIYLLYSRNKNLYSPKICIAKIGNPANKIQMNSFMFVFLFYLILLTIHFVPSSITVHVPPISISVSGVQHGV